MTASCFFRTNIVDFIKLKPLKKIKARDIMKEDAYTRRYAAGKRAAEMIFVGDTRKGPILATCDNRKREVV